MNKSKHIALFLFLATLVISLCSCSTDESSDGVHSDSTVAPTLLSIQILNSEGNQITPDESGWISLTPVCIISVDYSGIVTKADFYAVPSGTETDSEKFLIGTVDASNIFDSTVSLEWQPYSSFMGYISAVLYNDKASTSSEENYLVKAHFE